MTNPFVGRTIAEKYRIESVIRTGKFATLFRAVRLLTNKPVLIKILAPNFSSKENAVANFTDEQNISQAVAHKNVANAIDYGAEKDGTRYIVFDDVQGDPLEEIMKHEGHFSLERANDILRQIADALSNAHAKQMIHGGLTSRKILVERNPNGEDPVKILDFGAQQDLDWGSADDAIRNYGFLSPEQCAQDPSADQRSDIYSAGIILYEMLAGELPFKGATTADVIAKQIQEPPLPLTAYRADLPAGIDRVLLRALAKNPAMRYQDATDFARELDEVVHPSISNDEEITLVRGEPTHALESDEVSAFEKPAPNVWKTAFITLAGIVVLSSFFIYFTRIRQNDLPSQLPTDANGQPVQPVNPASGTTEDSLANMSGYTIGGGASSNSSGIPDAANDPWSRRGFPPAGAPNYGVPYQVQPGGPVITIQNSNSPFMPQEYPPYPVNANARPSPTVSPKPSPSPQASPQPSVVPNVTPTPAVETNTQKPVPVERPREVTPKPKPTPSIIKPVQPSKEDKNG